MADDDSKTTPEPAPPTTGDTEPPADGFVLGVGRCDDPNHTMKGVNDGSSDE